MIARVASGGKGDAELCSVDARGAAKATDEGGRGWENIEEVGEETDP